MSSDPSNKILKFAFFGTSQFSVFIAQELKEKFNIIPSLIVTVPDAPTGRKQIMTQSLLKEWAIKNNIEIVSPESLRESKFSNHTDYEDLIKKLSSFDVFLVASYGKIIPEGILKLAKIGPLNIHPSKLPLYRGPSPIQYQILNNEKDIQTTVMIMDKEVDHGDIVEQSKLSNEIIAQLPLSFFELEKELALISAHTVAPYLACEKEIKGIQQNHEVATFTKLIEKEDAHIILSELKAEIDSELKSDEKQIDEYKNYLTYLAFKEWPRAFTVDAKHNKRLIIIDARFDKELQKFIPLVVIPEGGKEMKYEDYLRGR